VFDCVPVGTTVTFPVTATAQDGGAITLSARHLPIGASFPTVTGVGSAAGTFTWAIPPEAAQIEERLNFAVFVTTDAGTPVRTNETATFFDVEAVPILTSQ